VDCLEKAGGMWFMIMESGDGNDERAGEGDESAIDCDADD